MKQLWPGETPIFDGDVKPVHVGIYKVGGFSGAAPLYSLWNGECWMAAATSVKSAKRRKQPSFFQGKCWVGLANAVGDVCKIADAYRKASAQPTTKQKEQNEYHRSNPD